MKKCTIYGERCSGTSYLENLIKINFDCQLHFDFCWKHFFGFNDEQLKHSEDTLFICIVRNPIDWINSLYKPQHHWYLKYKKMDDTTKMDAFLYQ